MSSPRDIWEAVVYPRNPNGKIRPQRRPPAMVEISSWIKWQPSDLLRIVCLLVTTGSDTCYSKVDN